MNEFTEALNYHGVFFKKRIIQELRRVHGLGVIAEELGVTFGETRVLDILAIDQEGVPPVYYAIECKRAWRQRKRWFFFKDCVQPYRVARDVSSLMAASSVFAVGTTPPVCSEGYELDAQKPAKSEQTLNKADQDPVFKAGTQLAGASLGFVARRLRELHRSGSAGAKAHVERVVPVLVTNVEMFVVEDENWSAVDLASGCFDGAAKVTAADYVVLKQPFPTPEKCVQDFRESPSCSPDMDSRYWNQLFTESLHVVRATALLDFFGPEKRARFRTVATQS